MRLISFFICAVFLANLLPAADIFISIDGDNGSGEGTIENPYRDIWRALQFANPGDTIYLRAGTYVGSNSIADNLSVSDANNPITIRGYQNESVTVQAGEGQWQVFYIDNLEGITLANLTLVPIAGNNALTILNSDKIILSNVIISGMASNKPIYARATTDLTVEDCQFDGNGSGVIELDNVQGITIANSQFAGNQAAPIVLTYGGTGTLSFEGNTVTNHLIPGVSLIEVNGLNGGSISSNTFSGNVGADLIRAHSGTSGLTVTNNSFTENYPEDSSGFNLVSFTSGGSGNGFSGNSISNSGPAPGSYSFANVLLVLSTNAFTASGNTVTDWSMPGSGSEVGTGMVFKGSSASNKMLNLTLSGNNLSGTGANAVELDYLQSVTASNESYTSSLIILNSDSVAFSGMIHELTSGKAIFAASSSNLSITNSTFEENLNGVIELEDIQTANISTNTFLDNRGAQIILAYNESSNIQISGNSFTDNLPQNGGNMNLVEFFQAGSGNEFSSNTIRNPGFIVNDSFLGVNALVVAATPNFILTGNTLTDWSMPAAGGGEIGSGWVLVGTSSAQYSSTYSITLNNLSGLPGIALNAQYINDLNVSDESYENPVILKDVSAVTFADSILSGISGDFQFLVSDGVDINLDGMIWENGSGTALSLSAVHGGSVINSSFLENRSQNTFVATDGVSNFTLGGNSFTNNYPSSLTGFSVINLDNCGSGITISSNQIIQSGTHPTLSEDASPSAIKITATDSVNLSNNTVSDFYFIFNGVRRGIGYDLAGTDQTPMSAGSFVGNNFSGGQRSIVARYVDNLSISNQSYNVAALVEYSSNLTISNVTFADILDETALQLSSVDTFDISSSTFTGNLQALSITGGSNGTVSAQFSEQTGEVTLGILGGTGHTINSSTFTNNISEDLGGFAIISIFGGSDHAITNNTIQMTGGSPALPAETDPVAVSITQATGSTISDNLIDSFAFSFSGESRGIAFSLQGTEEDPIILEEFSNNQVVTAGLRFLSANNMDSMNLSSTTFTAPLSVSNTNSLSLEDCTFNGFTTETPLIVSDLNNLSINASTFSNNEVASVSINNIASSAIINSEFFSNTSTVTVIVSGGSDLTFSGNILTDNFPDPVKAHSVISISDMTGTVTANGNILTNNQAVIDLTEDAFPIAMIFEGCAELSLSNNSVSSFLYTWEDSHRGIVYQINGLPGSPTSMTTFLNNDASGVGGRALTATYTTGIDIDQADYDSSIFIADSSNASIQNSLLTGNPGEPTVTFTNLATFSVTGSTFTGGGDTAIKIIDSSAGTIDSNTLSGNHGNVGLEISGTASSSITVSNNQFTDITPDPVIAHSVITVSGAGPAISLTGNTVTNTEALIPLSEESSPIAFLTIETSGVSLSGNSVTNFGFTWDGDSLGVAYKFEGTFEQPMSDTIFTDNTASNVAYRAFSANYLDTIYLSNLTYESHLAFENSSSIDLENITSRNTGGEPAVFFLNCNDFSVTESSFSSHSGIAIKVEQSVTGLISENNFTDNSGDSTVDVEGTDTSGINITNNIFTNNYSSPLASFSGISVSLGASSVSISGNNLEITDPITGFPDDASAIGILVDSIPDIEVTGNTISGYNLTTVSGLSSGVGIDLSGTAESPLDGTLLSGNIVSNAGTRGVDLQYLDNLTISSGSYTSPLRIQNAGDISISGSSYSVLANEPAVSLVQVSSATVSGSFADNPGFALYFEDVNNIAVTESQFNGNHGEAVIQVAGSETSLVSVSNNTFTDNWPIPLGQHSVISFVNTESADVSITGNLISNSENPGNLPDSTTAFAINAPGVPGPAISNNTITDFIYGSGQSLEGTAIYLGGSPESVIDLSGIGDNTISGAGKRAYSISYGSNLSLEGTYDAPVRIESVTSIAIANATFENVSRGAITLEQAEPALAVVDSSFLLVENSSFHDNSGFAIEVQDTSDAEIRANTFTDNSASATVVVKGSQSTNLTISDNVAINNYPEDLGILTGDIGEFSVLRVNAVGPGPLIENNRIINEGEITATGAIEADRFAFGIAIDATDDVIVRGNEVRNIRYPGYIDLKDPYNPDHTISPEEGGVIGTGISVAGALNANITGVLVEENEVHDNANRGIIVYISSDSIIRNNQVSYSGQYGILLSGDSLAKQADRGAARNDTMTGNIIEGNTVWESGWLHGGMSGIALFHAGTDDGSFANIVRNNLSYNTRQGSYPQKGWDWYNDGMGIIFDVESNGNIAYNNLCVNNDGPGIGVVKSDDCQVIHNTITGNGSLESAEFSEDLYEKPGIEVTRGPPEEEYTADNCVVYSNLLYNNRRYQMTLPDSVGHSVGYNLLTPGPDSLTVEDNVIFTDPYFIADPNATVEALIVDGIPGFSGYPEQVLLQNYGILDSSDGYSAGAELAYFLSEWGINDLGTDFLGAPRDPASPNIGAFDSIPAGFFGDEMKTVNGFWRSETFGQFYNLEFPWIYLIGHGWILAVQDGVEDNWIWDPVGQTWYFWHLEAFPWSYDPESGNWVDWSGL